MVRTAEDSSISRRLTDLRDSQPADATMRNLLGVLSAKLELCSRLSVFEWEAEEEGHQICADAFGRLADVERQSCAEVLDCLRGHIERRATVTGSAGR